MKRTHEAWKRIARRVSEEGLLAAHDAIESSGLSSLSKDQEQIVGRMLHAAVLGTMDIVATAASEGVDVTEARNFDGVNPSNTEATNPRPTT